MRANSSQWRRAIAAEREKRRISEPETGLLPCLGSRLLSRSFAFRFEVRRRKGWQNPGKPCRAPQADLCIRGKRGMWRREEERKKSLPPWTPLKVNVTDMMFSRLLPFSTVAKTGWKENKDDKLEEKAIAKPLGQSKSYVWTSVRRVLRRGKKPTNVKCRKEWAKSWTRGKIHPFQRALNCFAAYSYI